MISPAYNVGAFVQCAMASVLRQTEHRFAYIVVDDGSTDDTLAQAEAMAALDGRVTVLRTDHRGSGAARNAGLALADTPFVSFLDADDVWHPTKLARQLALLQSLPASTGAVFCGSRIVTVDGSVMWRQRARQGFYDYDDLVADYSPPGNGSSLLIRRSCFDDTRLFDESLPSSVDMDLWYEFAYSSRTPLFYGSPELLVDYRRRPGSVTSSLSSHIRNLDALLEHHCGRMRRLPPGAGYVKPALYALEKGPADVQPIAENWRRLALQAGGGYLLRHPSGRRLLAMSAGGPYVRRAIRPLRAGAFGAVRTMAAAGSKFRLGGTHGVRYR